ncbi:MAG: O-antigen ligase family protein, partial [Candidatus Omnitrophica bacterium]|nr:O-antigen ligase family protein [Candidatus Omnitrophota bacterium]
LQMLIPLGIACALTHKAFWGKSIFVFFTSVMMLGLLLSLSRAGKLCFFAVSILFFILLRIKIKIRNTVTLIVLLGLFLSFFIVAIGWKPIVRRLDTLASPLQVYNARFLAVKDSLMIYRDFPVWGTGLGTAGEIFQRYKTFNDAQTWRFIHNEPLQLLVETGVVGFLFVSIFFILYGMVVWKSWRANNSFFAVSITLGCMVGIAAGGLHSLLDFVFHVPAVAVVFTILLGLGWKSAQIGLVGQETPLKETDVLSPLFKILGGVTAIALFSAVLLFLWNRYHANQYFEKVANKEFNGSVVSNVVEYKRVLVQIDKAIAANPFKSEYYARKADLLSEPLVDREFLANLLRVDARFGRHRLAQEAGINYKTAIALNPTQASYHLKLGWLYATIDRDSFAREEFQKALILDPQNNKIEEYCARFLNNGK